MAIEVRFKKGTLKAGLVEYNEITTYGLPKKIEPLWIRKWILEVAFKGWPEEIHVSISTPIQK